MTDVTQVSQDAVCEVNFIHQDQVRVAQDALLGTQSASDLAYTFQALADPTRVRMVSALSSTELCVCDLAALLGMTQSAVSHQLRTLRDRRLVKSRRTGREIVYTLDDEHIRALYELGRKHILHH